MISVQGPIENFFKNSNILRKVQMSLLSPSHCDDFYSRDLGHMDESNVKYTMSFPHTQIAAYRPLRIRKPYVNFFLSITKAVSIVAG